MTTKPSDSNQFNRKDFEVILEVNKKAIEIETAVADQNEEIITLLNQHKTHLEQHKSNLKELECKTDKIHKQTEDLSKDMFKLQVLFVTGLLSLIAQIIQFFLKK